MSVITFSKKTNKKKNRKYVEVRIQKIYLYFHFYVTAPKKDIKKE